jgi:tRNA-dihydrouridine synthase A
MTSPRISIAPMMDCTDRHYRYLARLMSRGATLYTEMLTPNAIIHGDREQLLGQHPSIGEVVLQLGGSQPKDLVKAAKIGVDWGYSEINLNIGCPSDRVQAGRFGVCLMKEPRLVAECVAALKAAVDVPITVKTRIGVDHQDEYSFLRDFVDTVRAAGCQRFIIHARKAWLKGLSPKQNRTVPPLKYDAVYRLKADFPDLAIEINGGINTDQQLCEHLVALNGVMVGRQAYSDSYWLASWDSCHFNLERASAPLTRWQILRRYLDYVSLVLPPGEKPGLMLKHALGLFQGEPGARHWRRLLVEKSRQTKGLRDLYKALESLDN